MLDIVGRVPAAGDSVAADGFRLTALDVRGRRIGRVRIEPTRGPDESGATGSGDGAVVDAPRAGDASPTGT
jgi:hypothetical protein